MSHLKAVLAATMLCLPVYAAAQIVTLTAESPDEVAPGGMASITWRLDGGRDSVATITVRVSANSMTFDIGAAICERDVRFTGADPRLVQIIENGDLRVTLVDPSPPVGVVSDGPVFRCLVPVLEAAEPGDYQLTTVSYELAKASGDPLAGAVVDATVLLRAEPAPTRTETAVPTQTHTPTITPTTTPTGTPTALPVDIKTVLAAQFDPLPPLVADVNGDRRVSVADVVAYVKHFRRLD